MKEAIATICGTLTAAIGYHIHGGWFYTAIDFVFCPFVWMKWLLCHDVNMTIIKETLAWFFQ